MPPAFVLSQNQTLKLMYDKLRRNRPKQAGLWEPFLHKYTNWCVCVLGHLLIPPRQAAAKVTLRNGINLTDRSIPRGYRRPGRRPHVPSSKPTMSKSRRVSAPGRLIPGVGSRQRETRTRWRSVKAAAAAVRGHIWGVPPTVNSLFQKSPAKSHQGMKKPKKSVASTSLRRFGYTS
jgi:hypothetical protein